MNPPPLQQLRDEALTMLVLWAASRDYSPDIEQLLKLFAKTFEISESELTERLIQAADGKLIRPDANGSSAADAVVATGVDTPVPVVPAAPAMQPVGSAPAVDGASDKQPNNGQQLATAAEQHQQAEPMQQ